MITENMAQRYRAAESRLWGYYNVRTDSGSLTFSRQCIAYTILN